MKYPLYRIMDHEIVKDGVVEQNSRFIDRSVKFGPVNPPPIFRSALNKGGVNGGSEVITWSNSVITQI